MAGSCCFKVRKIKEDLTMKIINIKVVGRNFTKVTPLILQDEDCETEESIGNRVEYWVFSNWPDYDLSWSWEFENDPEVILKVIQKEISETTAKIHFLKSYKLLYHQAYA